MAVLSSRAQERRSHEKFAREARENERRSREKNKVAPAPISSRFLCPRPPLLLSSPNQNCHATQANAFPETFTSATSIVSRTWEFYSAMPFTVPPRKSPLEARSPRNSSGSNGRSQSQETLLGNQGNSNTAGRLTVLRSKIFFFRPVIT